MVVVTATNDAGDTTVASAATGEVLPLAPANVTPPSISGTPVDGWTLTADPGTWTGTDPIDFGYQWQRCDADGTNCVDILGADDSDLHARARRHRRTILQVVVTASNDAGSVQQRLDRRPPVAEPAPPVNTVAPGRLRHARGRLDADRRPPATGTGTAPITYDVPVASAATSTARNCVDIPGATGSHLRPHARRHRPPHPRRGHRDATSPARSTAPRPRAPTWASAARRRPSIPTSPARLSTAGR